MYCVLTVLYVRAQYALWVGAEGALVLVALEQDDLSKYSNRRAGMENVRIGFVLIQVRLSPPPPPPLFVLASWRVFCLIQCSYSSSSSSAFTIHCSLFTVHCSLFTVHCSPLTSSVDA